MDASGMIGWECRLEGQDAWSEIVGACVRRDRPRVICFVESKRSFVLRDLESCEVRRPQVRRDRPLDEYRRAIDGGEIDERVAAGMKDLDDELRRDADWLLANPDKTMDSKYHDAGRALNLADEFRNRLHEALAMLDVIDAAASMPPKTRTDLHSLQLRLRGKA